VLFLGSFECWPEMEVKGEATDLLVQDLNRSRAQGFSRLQKTSRPAMGPTQPPVQGGTESKVSGA
jgi:hypothetical protein